MNWLSLSDLYLGATQGSPANKSVSVRSLRWSELLLAVALFAVPISASAEDDIWTDGDNTSVWSDPLNWSALAVPSNGNVAAHWDVFLNTSMPADLDLDPTLNSLSIASAGELDIQNDHVRTLSIAGGLITDNGLMIINSNQGTKTTALMLGSDAMLGGSGVLRLNGEGAAAQLNSAPGVTLMQASTHTIAGHGEVNASLTNHGTVDANVSGGTLSLAGTDKSNDRLLRASNGGTLDIGGIRINNTGGTILAANGSAVNLHDGAFITSGVLNTAGTGAIQTTAGNTTLSNVTNAGMFNIVSGSTTVTGTKVTNNGVVDINVYHTPAPTILDVASNLTLGGTGVVMLDSDGGAAQINTEPNVTLTQTSDIRGRGVINAALVNNGGIEANIFGRALTLQGHDKVNNGIMDAAFGGILEISSTGAPTGVLNVVQGSSPGWIAANNGTVELTGGVNIHGGLLGSTNGGRIQITAGSNTLTGPITNFAEVDVLNGTSLTVTGGILTNNGSISVNATGGRNPTQLIFAGDTALSGNGVIGLYDDGGTTQLNTASGTLTQASAHTIRGRGVINAAMVNHGAILADARGRTLVLTGNPKTGDGTFRATDGATLQISGINAGGPAAKLIADGGSTISLNSAAVNAGAFTNHGAVSLDGGSSLTISGASVSSGSFTNNGVVKVAGGGSLTVAAGANIAGAGALAVNDTALLAFAHSATPQRNTVGSLAVGSSGQVDLANNAIQVDFGNHPSPDAAVRALILSGRNGGNWGGMGITSSDAAANPTVLAVGYADGADGLVPGLTVGSELIRTTVLGDPDLDGIVTFPDLVTLARHYGASNAKWDQGDFNFDGSVGFDDLEILARHYSQPLTPAESSQFNPSFQSDVEAAFAQLPEPASLPLLALVLATLQRPSRSGFVNLLPSRFNRGQN